jgi:hypothetical protein
MADDITRVPPAASPGAGGTPSVEREHQRRVEQGAVECAGCSHHGYAHDVSGCLVRGCRCRWFRVTAPSPSEEPDDLRTVLAFVDTALEATPWPDALADRVTAAAARLASSPPPGSGATGGEEPTNG